MLAVDQVGSIAVPCMHSCRSCRPVGVLCSHCTGEFLEGLVQSLGPKFISPKVIRMGPDQIGNGPSNLFGAKMRKQKVELYNNPKHSSLGQTWPPASL